MEEENLQKENEEVKVEENKVTIEEDISKGPWHIHNMSCKSAKTLYTIGTVVLVVGLILGVGILVICAEEFERVTECSFLIGLVGCFVFAVLPSLIVFAFAHAVADIAENTHKLANKAEKD